MDFFVVVASGGPGLWGKYLGDVAMASTILDRLMNRCAMLEFEGKSYRVNVTATRIAIAPVSS